MAPPVRKQSYSKSDLYFLLIENERYQTALNYCSYRLIYILQRGDDYMASKWLAAWKNVATQLKDIVYHENDLISVVNVLT